MSFVRFLVGPLVMLGMTGFLGYTFFGTWWHGPLVFICLMCIVVFSGAVLQLEDSSVE